MTSKSLLAAASAALLLGAAQGAMAAPDAPKPPPVTQAVYKSLSLVSAAIAKADYAAAQAAIDAARQVPNRKPYDDLKINEFAMSVHLKQNDLAAADVDAEAAADTDPANIPDAEKGHFYKAALQLAMIAKHYDKAAKYGKALLALTPPPDDQTQQMIAQALYFSGDTTSAVDMASKRIAAAKAANQKPSLSDLSVILKARSDAKDEVAAEATLEEMIAYYDRPENWSLLLGASLNNKSMRDYDYIYVGRLIVAKNAQVSTGDAQVIGSTANRSALYGDAEAMQKSGGPAPDPRMAQDKKSISGQIAAEAKNGGEYAVKTAEVLYGYGMYAEAEAAARLAQSKGGAKDPTEVPMVIGMAQAAQGKYADAVTTFASINTNNPASARVIRLWGYYAKAKANPSTTAAQ